jgi:TPR repeat protein
MQSTELQFVAMAQATKDILVGYVEEDRNRAQQLIAVVKKAELSPTAVIFDGLSPDDDLLQRPVETARCFVVLWSQAAAHSSAVKELTGHAIQAWWLARLVLLTLDDAPLPTGLRDVPTAPLTESASDVAELVARIKKIANESSTASRRLSKRKIATFVVLGLLLALGSGAGSLLYRSSHRPSPQPKHGLELQDLDTGLLLEPNFVAPLLDGKQTETSDKREAARLYKFAAEKGNSDAQRKLASFYEFGWGRLPQDNAQAARLYKLSADQGNAAAQLELGAVFEVGRIGVQKNDEQARRYYQLSADKGNAEAQYALGRFNESGRGGLPFVSYSRADSSVVDQLVAQIEKFGYAVWMDRKDQSAQRYAASIVGAIRKAHLVALMCSQHSVASDQVLREVYVAGDYKKPFVVFQLDSTDLPDDFLYFLSGYPRIRAADLNIAKLRAQIEKTMVGA